MYPSIPRSYIPTYLLLLLVARSRSRSDMQEMNTQGYYFVLVVFIVINCYDYLTSTPNYLLMKQSQQTSAYIIFIFILESSSHEKVEETWIIPRG